MLQENHEIYPERGEGLDFYHLASKMHYNKSDGQRGEGDAEEGGRE